jgi:hypothetical protein
LKRKYAWALAGATLAGSALYLARGHFSAQCEDVLQITVSDGAQSRILHAGRYQVAFMAKNSPRSCTFDVPYGGSSCSGDELYVLSDKFGVCGFRVYGTLTRAAVRLSRNGVLISAGDFVRPTQSASKSCQRFTLPLQLPTVSLPE